jgi:mRNA interferase RelE/StbE
MVKPSASKKSSQNMAWKIEFTDKAEKQFTKIDHVQQKKITDYLRNRITKEPFAFGKSLSGDRKGLWRYRVSDYRIICEIHDQKLLVLIVDVGHRKDIYRH